MSNTNPGSDKFKLKAELQKRKTQEIKRSIAMGQAARARGSDTAIKSTIQTAPAQAEPGSRSVVNPAPRSETQRSPLYQRVTQVRRSVRTQLTRRQTMWIMILLAIGLFVLVGLGTISLASSATQIPPTLWAVPQNVDAASLSAYLNGVGLTAVHLRQYDPQTSGWHAQEEREFDLVRGANKADVIVLTYKSRDSAVPDTFALPTSAKFKNWRWLTLANVIVLVSPESDKAFGDEIFGHTTQFIMAPNHPLWPTATLSVTLTAAGTVSP